MMATQRTAQARHSLDVKDREVPSPSEAAIAAELSAGGAGAPGGGRSADAQGGGA
jgi:hypothetical protein